VTDRLAVGPPGRRRAARAVRAIAAAVLPAALRRWLRAQQRRLGLHRAPVGSVNFGALRRVSPVSPVFGIERGLPIDRYYIERFVSGRAADVRGRVLEIGDARYTRKFGGDRVTRSEVLHLLDGDPDVTIVADLTRADHVPADAFDCIICTQTIQMIYEPRPAVAHLHRILRPGGVLLITAHGTSRIARREGVDPWGEYWRMTAQGMRRLLAERFPADRIEIATYGNVLAAVASLHGLAAEDLDRGELDYLDPDFEVLVAARAVKAT